MALTTRLAISRSRSVSWLYERLVFAKDIVRTWRPNRAMRRDHPDFVVPPLSVLRDATASTSYDAYRRTGIESARGFWTLFRTHSSVPSGTRAQILEWGCGPARIIRHLPDLAAADGVAADFVGSDVNRTSVRWATSALPGIRFSTNDLAPPFCFDDGAFDFVYSWSVFTHLSEQMHHAWIAELRRVMRPGAVLVVSTHGASLRSRLTPAEQVRFDSGQLVTIERAREGKLMYAAFHPRPFMERLLSGFEIVAHDAPPAGQELWVARRTVE
jgi:SAM-dependent methyltransferase